MQTRPGLRLRSTRCSTEVVVVRAAAGEVVLTCCGGELTADDLPAAESTGEPGVLLGKRYADEETGLELLCTKPGPGELAVDGRSLPVKGSKPLPASD